MRAPYEPSVPRTTLQAHKGGRGPTVDDLPLALDDLFTEAAVLLQAAHGLAAVAQGAVAEQSVRLHLGVLHLQLVHAAQQAEHLALLFGADAPRQRLFQAPATRAQLPAALLQRQLREGGPGQHQASPTSPARPWSQAFWLVLQAQASLQSLFWVLQLVGAPVLTGLNHALR